MNDFQSKEHEQIVLGTMLTFDEFVPICVPQLEPSDFGNPAHEDVFEAVQQLHEDGADISTFTVRSWLKEQKDWSEDDTDRLANLQSHGTTPEGAQQSVDQVADRSTTARLAQHLSGLVSDMRASPTAVKDHLAEADRILSDNMNASQIPGLTYSQIKERDANRPMYEQLELGDPFMDTTFFSEYGSHKGAVCVSFADTGHGKTYLAAWKVARWLEQGYRGIFVIQEDVDAKIAERVYKNLAEDAKDRIDNLIIADRPQGVKNLGDTVSTIKYHNATGKLDFFAFDHLNIASVEGLNDWKKKQIISTTVNRLTQLAQEEDLAGEILHQVNRNALYKARGWSKFPDLYHLYGSSAVEQAAQMAIAVFRPRQYEELCIYNDKGEVKSVKGPNYANDKMDRFHPNSVFIRQRKVRDGELYAPMVRFRHNDKGLARVSKNQTNRPKAPQPQSAF